MRLFFAFALDDDVRQATWRLARDIQERLARARQPRAVKWVERENLHVTLRFLGEVGEDQSRPLLDALRSPLPIPGFDLVVGGAGAFPPAGAPRVLWAGVGAGSEAAQQVFELLDGRLSPLDIEREPRPYTPHLTLGRVREIDRAPGRELRDWLARAPATIGAVHVDRVTLYRSHLSSLGPTYEVVTEVPLS